MSGLRSNWLDLQWQQMSRSRSAEHVGWQISIFLNAIGFFANSLWFTKRLRTKHFINWCEWHISRKWIFLVNLPEYRFCKTVFLNLPRFQGNSLFPTNGTIAFWVQTFRLILTLIKAVPVSKIILYLRQTVTFCFWGGQMNNAWLARAWKVPLLCWCSQLKINRKRRLSDVPRRVDLIGCGLTKSKQK
jgi:hypothetical protein